MALVARPEPALRAAASDLARAPVRPRLSPRDPRRRRARLHPEGPGARRPRQSLNGFSWEDTWDNFTGPQAKAFHLLKKLDLGSAPDFKLKQAGQIIFQEFGGAPGNSYT